MPPKKASTSAAASVASASTKAHGKRKLNDLVPAEFDVMEGGKNGGQGKHKAGRRDDDRVSVDAHGRIICALCKLRPGPERPWASSLQQAPGAPLLPAGDQCVECQAFHAKHFAHLKWSDFIQWCETEAGQTAVNEARATARGDHRDFVLDTISAETRVFFRIERPMVVMNEREYKNYFNKPPPSVRGPKVPTLTLPKESNPGESEKVWCFEDPSMPMRRCMMVTEIGDKRLQSRLEPEDCVRVNHISNHLQSVSC